MIMFVLLFFFNCTVVIFCLIAKVDYLLSLSSKSVVVVFSDRRFPEFQLSVAIWFKQFSFAFKNLNKEKSVAEYVVSKPIATTTVWCLVLDDIIAKRRWIRIIFFSVRSFYNHRQNAFNNYYLVQFIEPLKHCRLVYLIKHILS